MAYATVNPYTGETLKTFATASKEEVLGAIDQAYTTFLAWKETSFEQRAAILNKAASILRNETDKYAKYLTLEMGKLFTEAKLETILSAEILEYYAKHAKNY